MYYNSSFQHHLTEGIILSFCFLPSLCLSFPLCLLSLFLIVYQSLYLSLPPSIFPPLSPCISASFVSLPLCLCPLSHQLCLSFSHAVYPSHWFCLNVSLFCSLPKFDKLSEKEHTKKEEIEKKGNKHYTEPFYVFNLSEK